MEAKLKGKVVFEFLESADGNWYSKVTPIMLPAADIRDTYKLALLVAVLQDTATKKLDIIDKIIREKHELEALEGGKVIADVEKYQQKLPFEEDTDEDRS